MSEETRFVEVADRVWVARHAWLDLNVTLIGGTRGLALIDTHASSAAARRVVDGVRRLGAGEVVAVVNTHEHFDHVLGNAVVRQTWAEAPIIAHEIAAAATPGAIARAQEELAADSADPHREEVLATEVLVADTTFSSATALDLGDRIVELVHPGRGHTAGDLVVRVPDADVLLAGDLVEESAPPGYGADCHPLDWPLTLDLVLDLTTPGTVVVPGHGAVTDRDFVLDQRSQIGVVAETIRDLASRGVPAAEALDAAEWPFATAALRHAVERGYAQLPRSQRRLPLV